MLVITCEGETTKINTSSSKNIYFSLLLLTVIINVLYIYIYMYIYILLAIIINVIYMCVLYYEGIDVYRDIKIN